MPLRIFTVTGTPAGSVARTTARTTAANSSVFQGRAAPPPFRVTLGTGQPKLRSTCSARPSPSSIRTAAAAVAGSVAYSWTLLTGSSGWCSVRRRDSGVRSTRARLVTISDT